MHRSAAVPILCLLLIAPAALALEECPEVRALDSLYGIRELVIRGSSSYTIDEQIDAGIHQLREPLRVGGYRWVSLVRPSGAGPVTKTERLVATAYGSQEGEVFEADGDNAFAVDLVVPRKRSLFRGNGESWVGTVKVQFTSDGETSTKTLALNRWIKPDSSRMIDLGTIAGQVHVSVDLATHDELTDGEALVEIHFRHAVEQDDPENPNYETIQALHRIRSSSSASVLDAEIEKLEHRLFPSLRTFPFATLLEQVREAEKLLRAEKEEDREKGMKELKEVVKAIE